MKRMQWWSSLLAAAILVGCGGGGGSAGTAPFNEGSGGTSGGGGGSVTPAPAAADLILTLSSAQLANSGSGTATVTVTAVDATRNTVARAPVTVTADSGAVVTATSTATDETGTLSAAVSLGSDRSNRVITITANSGTVSKSATLQVVGTSISSTLAPAVVAPGAAGQVQYRVVDQVGTPMSGLPVQVTATGMTPAQQTGTTGLNGDFTFSYTAPGSVGPVTVLASIGGATDTQTVQVQSASTVPAVTATISSASVSASPNVVAVNQAGSSTNRSQIRALFLGTNNLPIPNVRVRFDLAGDVNSIGGSFNVGTQTLYSDASGVVSADYIPGTRASPTDGVTVRACYGKTDTDPDLVNCTASALVKLTVTSEPLGVSIGTNGTIIVNSLTYAKEFIVSVVDSAGVAKADVSLSVSLDLPTYRKGVWVATTGGWAKSETITCTNEDANRNGVLEAGEDLDRDSRLDPGKSDVSVTLLQSKTGADGTAVLRVQYPQNFGSWVDALVTVSASGVSGTEGRAQYLLAPVPVPSAVVKDTNNEPAFRVSPYGTIGSCSDPN